MEILGCSSSPEAFSKWPPCEIAEEPIIEISISQLQIIRDIGNFGAWTPSPAIIASFNNNWPGIKYFAGELTGLENKSMDMRHLHMHLYEDEGWCSQRKYSTLSLDEPI